MESSSGSQGLIRRMNWPKVFWYLGFPALLSGTMLALFFSGVRLCETIVAGAHLEAVAFNSRREFGLLECSQNVLLLLVVGIAVRAAFKHRRRAIRAFMALVAAGTLFVLLEEIDYGLHVYEYLAGVPHNRIVGERNLHNVGHRTSVIKQASDAAMIAVFGIAPFVLARVRRRWVRYILPDPYMALVLIVAFLTRFAAHWLHDHGLGRGLGLDGNLAEFRELVTYYLGLVYTLHLARRSPDDLGETADAPRRLTDG